MRPKITTVLLGAAFVLGAGGVARAATFDVKVPFPFVVEGRTMPAGAYRVDDESGVILLHGEQHHLPSLFVMTTPANGRDPSGDRPALIFTHDESTYTLARVWKSRDGGLVVRR